jgi:multidrug efflux pump subunit AcrB
MARNSVAANLLMMTFLIGGVLAIPRIRQEVFPAFELDTVSVSVAYPGASPSEVEQGILLAVEESIRGIEGVKRVNSSAREGVGVVTAELLAEADGDTVVQDIKNEVDRLTSLPEDAEKPTVSLNVARRAVLSLVIHGDMDEDILRRLALSVKDELALDPEITMAVLSGVRPLEIAVNVPREQLRRHGLTLEQVAAAVTRSSVELGGGGVKTDAGEILIRTDERRRLGAEYADIPVLTRPDGMVVKLGDIATIEDAFADEDRETTYNGKRAASVVVYQVGNEDPVGVARAVRRRMETLRARLPEDVGLAIVGDRSEVYRDRLQLLLRNAGLGLALVMILLGLFLEVRLAFWVMMGVPVSFLGCLLFLPYFDVSINMISLFAFIIAVGIVVDDAIVVGESVYYERQRGKPHLQAAVDGVHAVSGPVVFAVLTNILAFLPLLFIPGSMGQIWRNIPIVISVIFAASLVEALVILPAHLAHGRVRAEGAVWRVLEKPQELMGRGLERFVERRFEPFIRRVLDHRYETMAFGLALLILAVGWVRGGRTGFTFFPKVESDRVTASAVLTYGAPFAETRAVEKILREAAWAVAAEHGGAEIVEGVYSTLGSHGQGFSPFSRSANAGASHLTSVDVNLVPLGAREIPAAEFTRLWRARVGALPGLESLSFRFNIGPSAGRPIDVQLTHADKRMLEQAAVAVAAALERFDGVVEIEDGIELGKPELVLKTRAEAQSLGVTASDMARQLRHAFYGVESRRQQRGPDELKVFVRLPKNERLTENDIERIVIRTPQGGEVPLLQAAEVRRSRAYQEIKRVDGVQVLNVTADIDEQRTHANKVIESLTQDVLPTLGSEFPGLGYSFEGEQREQRESFAGLRSGFIMVLFGLFAMLAVPFKSYAQALVVLVALPFGMIGALLGHIVMGYDLSFPSIMGLVALSGVVINDGILLVDTANTNRREGATAREAIERAPARRFRPVLLTSATTFLGLAPMIFETSVQARFLIPMALSLGFGIVLSTAITLLLMPALYLIVEDLRERFAPARKIST